MSPGHVIIKQPPPLHTRTHTHKNTYTPPHPLTHSLHAWCVHAEYIRWKCILSLNFNAEIRVSQRDSFSPTSVTMVLWKVSLLYSQPSWQLPEVCPWFGTPLWFKGAMQDKSAGPSVAYTWLRLKVTEVGTAAEGHVERQKCGGTAPVKIETSMWNARKIWGTQIHTYRIFWNFPNPPIRQRISSKFIFLAFCRCTLKCSTLI